MRTSAPSFDPTAPKRFDMTPMIDVVFQLIVFFLVSMRFRTLDMKIEALLPKDRGFITGPPAPPPPRMDVRLARSGSGAPTFVQTGAATLGRADDPETWHRFASAVTAFRLRLRDAGESGESARGEVAASPLVATADVIRAVDVLRLGGIALVEFEGAPPPSR